MPSPSLCAQRLVFAGKQEVHLEECELQELESDEVLVRTEFSLMSTGTENIVYNRLFDPGTHWDHWVKYPFYPGYCAVGKVERSRADTFQEGDRVAVRCGHQSRAIMAASRCRRIPTAIPPESALWFALAKIAFHGAQAADYRLGDQVLIIGAGPVGQMSVRWARAAGAASITVVDISPDRLQIALRGGATEIICSPIDRARGPILEANGNCLPGIVIDSTGNAAVFSAALGLAKQFGRVIVLGDTGQPTKQTLTPDVVIRGLTIMGAHDGHNTEQWNDATITQLFFSFVASGQFSLDGLNTHVFKPSAYAEAYAAANRERVKTMGILFDWSEQ